MLYIRYLLEEYDQLSQDTRILIFDAIKKGLQEKTITELQVNALILSAAGYSFDEISARLYIRAEEYLSSIWKYLESETQLSDYTILKKHKGRVQKHWIAKADKEALQ